MIVLEINFRNEQFLFQPTFSTCEMNIVNFAYFIFSIINILSKIKFFSSQVTPKHKIFCMASDILFVIIISAT